MHELGGTYKRRQNLKVDVKLANSGTYSESQVPPSVGTTTTQNMDLTPTERSHYQATPKV